MVTPEEGYRIAVREIDGDVRRMRRLEAELRADFDHDENVRGHWRDWEREAEETFLADIDWVLERAREEGIA